MDSDVLNTIVIPLEFAEPLRHALLVLLGVDSLTIISAVGVTPLRWWRCSSCVQVESNVRDRTVCLLSEKRLLLVLEGL